MEVFIAIWSYFELFGDISRNLELFGAIHTISNCSLFSYFSNLSYCPTFPTFPTFPVWSAQGLFKNISHLRVREIKSPPPPQSGPPGPPLEPPYRVLGGYRVRGLGDSSSIKQMETDGRTRSGKPYKDRPILGSAKHGGKFDHLPFWPPPPPNCDMR